MLLKASIAWYGTLSSSYSICFLLLQTKVQYNNKDKRSSLLSTLESSLDFLKDRIPNSFLGSESLKQFWVVSETESLLPRDYIPVEVSK